MTKEYVIMPRILKAVGHIFYSSEIVRYEYGYDRNGVFTGEVTLKNGLTLHPNQEEWKEIDSFIRDSASLKPSKQVGEAVPPV